MLLLLPKRTLSPIVVLILGHYTDVATATSLRSWFCQIIAATTTTETAPATNAATDVVWLLLVLLRYDCRVAEYTFRCIVTYLPPSFNFSLQSLFSVLLLFLRAAFGTLISLSVHSSYSFGRGLAMLTRVTVSTADAGKSDHMWMI